MVQRVLYEIQHDRSFYRVTNGPAIFVDTYAWNESNVDESVSDFISINEPSGEFKNWIAENGVDRVTITRKIYETDTSVVEEVSKRFYYVNENPSDENFVSFRVSGLPLEHLEDSKRLVGDGLVQLYEIKLADGTYLHIKADNDVKWNGYDWTGIPLKFEGYSSSTGDSLSRPTFSISNPDGAWSTFVRDGLLTRAVITRYTVLYDDIKKDRAIYQKRMWIIWYPKTLNKQFISFELRNPMDGVNFDIPARMYMPPEFPFVAY